MTVRAAHAEIDLEEVRILIGEYVDGLGMDLSFQGFATEMASLPGRYAPPGGALFVAHGPKGRPAGCVGVRPLDMAGACELKRLYVRAEARGTGTGRALADAALGFAADAGYRRVLLDTMPQMRAAQALYRAMGFAEVAPYQDETVPGMMFFEKGLP